MKHFRSFAVLSSFLPLILSVIIATAQAGDLQVAIRNGDISAVRTALDAEADVNAGEPPPLYFALKQGELEIAKLLIEHGANVNATGSYWGPLLYTAVNQDRSDLIKLLLAHAANPNAVRTMDSETALHVAAGRGCLPCVEALVEAGADVNAITKGEWAKTPIHLARLFNHQDVADYLIAHGVKLPRPPPILSKVRSADPNRGRKLFAKRFCSDCHDASRAAAMKRGPPLWNVVGRRKAALPGFKYSKSLQSWGGNWTYDDLNTWIYGAAVTTPGVFMEIAGVQDDLERADIIVFLRFLSDKPIPLPQ